MKRFAKVLALVLALTFVLAACGNQTATSTAASTATSSKAASSTNNNAASAAASSDVAKSKHEGTLIYGVAAEPGKIDPQNNGIIPGMCIERQIYDPLIDKDPKTGEFIPGLATSWEWVDGSHLKLELRKGVKFHNGEDFTAADVDFTTKRFPTGAATASLFAGFDPENNEIVDDHTIILAMKYPFAPALNFLTNGRAYIVSKTWCDANGEDALTRSANGTGAYKFVEWVVGSNVDMVANEDYWGGAPEFKKLTVKFIIEDTARMVALETGEIDIASEIQDADITRALEGKVDHIVGYAVPSYKIWHLDFNVMSGDTAEIFQKKEVRLAVAHAVDWQTTIKAAAGQCADPATSCLASTIDYYKNVGIYEYDPELSKQLLKDAGYENGFEFTVSEEEIPLAIRVLETVQAYLAEVGITMNIEQVDTATWNENNSLGVNQATVGNMTAMTGDPAHTLNGCVLGAASMTSKITDQKFNDLYDAGMQEQDTAKRAQIYAELQDWVFENAFQIPMYQQTITYGVWDYIDNFTPDHGLQIECKYCTYKG